MQPAAQSNLQGNKNVTSEPLLVISKMFQNKVPAKDAAQFKTQK